MCDTDCQDLPQVQFIRHSGGLDDMDFAEETMNDLSSDLRLLLEYVCGISKGEVSSRFAVSKIGPLDHARWLNG